MEKKGISAIIATVLIILIVVVGVGIVWKVILPLFAELGYLSYSDVQLNIVRQGYTVYDPEMKFAFVQIERGRDEINVTGLEIAFNFNGSTKTYQTKEVPEPGGKYTYKFNFTADGLEEEGNPNKVSVAPIFLLNNKPKLGKILDNEDMPMGKVYLTLEKWKDANLEAEDNDIVDYPNGGDEPGVPVEPVVPVCVPVDEICDNLVDDDCDGLIDEFCSCPLYPDCPGDMNGDNVVNGLDSAIYYANYLERDCGVSNLCCNGADLNTDSYVNFRDYVIFSNNYMNVC